MGKLAQEVNTRLDDSTKSENKGGSSTTKGDGKSGSFLAKVTVNALNIRKGLGTGYAKVGRLRDRGIYTIVETSGSGGGSSPARAGSAWTTLRKQRRLRARLPRASTSTPWPKP